jgi:hypothetical protein
MIYSTAGVAQLTIYRSHLVSDYHQSKWRDTVLDELKARGQGIYCIHDYWQKYLPQKHKNAQSDAFGARGISVHGKVQTRK